MGIELNNLIVTQVLHIYKGVFFCFFFFYCVKQDNSEISCSLPLKLLL